ncbi:metal-dependent hydrolase [Sporosarcina sp. 179-K 3D1 HS]|uniref:metal-dependent hydrolase n=1 Tax=Sporosarcina sp. 179-K 3D1 HS TaxID=3232169 RepID=UPI0039A0475A
MKGTSHLVIGTAAGACAGLYLNADPLTLVICAAVGGLSGVMPDLDTNGLASNTVTLSKKKVKTPLLLMGIGVVIYAFYQFIQGTDAMLFKQLGIGVGMVILSAVITQKRMLTLTGVGIVMGGVALDRTWLVLLGIFVILASFLPHRSYTHSLLGLGFFSLILQLAQTDLQLEGLYLAGMAGYASHLVADMRILPMNRRGVKLFAPVWNKEF